MPFEEIDERYNTTIDLPIKGKTYSIESVDAETGLWAQRMMSAAGLVEQAEESGKDITSEEIASLRLDDKQEIDLYRRLMGEAYDQMLADKVPWEWVKLAGTTTLIWCVSTRDEAEKFWNAGGSPEAKRPEPQDRKAPARKARQGSTGGKTPAVVEGEVIPGPPSSTTGDLSRTTSTSGTASTSTTDT